MTYNYENFDARAYDLAGFCGPKPGSKAPNPSVETATGQSRKLLEFEGKFLVLEMGSLTCPLFQGRRNGMTDLVQRHEDVSFAVLYVREAHPGQNTPAHQTMADKQACARSLAESEGRQVLVDDLNGSAHEAFGGYPNSVFIINRSGCVVYASDWNNPRATGRALEQLMSGKPAQVRAYFRPVPPWIVRKTFQTGGAGSGIDFIKGFPRLVWFNLIRRNLRLLLGKSPVVAPDADC